MNNSLENLENRLTNIRGELEDLKAKTIEEDKKQKEAKDLKEKMDAIEIELKQIIYELKSKAEQDASIESELKRAEQLSESFGDITQLYNDIVNGDATSSQGGFNKQGSNTGGNNTLLNNSQETKDKNIFSKTWDRTKDQWNDVFSKEKRKEDLGKNLLRTAGFAATGVGAVALVYKGIKKLFGWGKDKENKNGEISKAGDVAPTEKKIVVKTKKPFWDRWYGKALKWGLITAGGIFGIKWLGERLDLRGTDTDKPTDDESSEVKYEAFDELPEAMKETYNKLGDKVDQVYESVNKRELDAGFQDPITMDRTAREVEGGNLDYTGIIPFCIDNKFGSVEELLSQNSSLLWNLQFDVRNVLHWIRCEGRDTLEFFAKNYLSKFGFGPVNFVGDKLAQAIENRSANDESKQREIKLFYRQSIRMERYFFEKKKQLAEKLAENNGFGKTKEEILNDDNLFDTFVGNHSDYKAFLTGGIATAITILEKYGLLDNKVGEDTTKIVGELDGQRDSITGNANEDIAKKIYEKEETAEITPEEKEKLKNACTKMKEDIDKTICPALEDSPVRCYEELLGGSDNTQIKEFIEKGGMIQQLSNCGNVLGSMGNKIDQLSTKDIKILAEQLNTFLALKKEIIMGGKTIDNEDHTFWGNIYKCCCAANNTFLNACKKIANGQILEGLADMAIVAPVILIEAGTIMVVIGGVRYVCSFGKKGKTLVVNGLKVSGYIPYVAGRRAYKGAKTASRASSGIKVKINPRTFSDETMFNKFIDDIKSRKISLSQAGDEITNYMMKNRGQKADDLIRKLGLDHQTANDPLHIEKKLIDKAFPDSENLRKLKADKALYERAIKSYHSCNEVKEFIDGQGDVNSLKTALDTHEQQLAQEAKRTPTEFSEKCKVSRDKSTLKQEFETERSKLQRDADIKKTAKEQAEKTPGLNREENVRKANRKLKEAEKKLNQLNKIEENVKQAMTELEKTNPRRLETALDNLLGDTEKIVKKLCGSTNHGLLDLMKDIDVINNLVDTVKDTNGKKVFNSVDDLIKKLNGNYIEELKNTYHIKFSSGAVENRLKTIAEDISEIRVRNTIGLVDDAMEALKRVFKIGSKISKIA